MYTDANWSSNILPYCLGDLKLSNNQLQETDCSWWEILHTKSKNNSSASATVHHSSLAKGFVFRSCGGDVSGHQLFFERK